MDDVGGYEAGLVMTKIECVLVVRLPDFPARDISRDFKFAPNDHGAVFTAAKGSYTYSV